MTFGFASEINFQQIKEMFFLILKRFAPGLGHWVCNNLIESCTRCNYIPNPATRCFSFEIALSTHQPQSYTNFRSLTLSSTAPSVVVPQPLIFTLQDTTDDVYQRDNNAQGHVKKQRSSSMKQRFDNGNRFGALHTTYSFFSNFKLILRINHKNAKAISLSSSCRPPLVSLPEFSGRPPGLCLPGRAYFRWPFTWC